VGSALAGAALDGAALDGELEVIGGGTTPGSSGGALEAFGGGIATDSSGGGLAVVMAFGAVVSGATGGVSGSLSERASVGPVVSTGSLGTSTPSKSSIGLPAMVSCM